MKVFEIIRLLCYGLVLLELVLLVHIFSVKLNGDKAVRLLRQLLISLAVFFLYLETLVIFLLFDLAVIRDILLLALPLPTAIIMIVLWRIRRWIEE